MRRFRVGLAMPLRTVYVLLVTWAVYNHVLCAANGETEVSRSCRTNFEAAAMLSSGPSAVG